jgi:hypothetical protein
LETVFSFVGSVLKTSWHYTVVNLTLFCILLRWSYCRTLTMSFRMQLQ